MTRAAPTRRAKHKTVSRKRWHRKCDRWQATDLSGDVCSSTIKPVWHESADVWTIPAGTLLAHIGRRGKPITPAQAAASLRRIVP